MAMAVESQPPCQGLPWHIGFGVGVGGRGPVVWSSWAGWVCVCSSAVRPANWAGGGGRDRQVASLLLGFASNRGRRLFFPKWFILGLQIYLHPCVLRFKKNPFFEMCRLSARKDTGESHERNSSFPKR